MVVGVVDNAVFILNAFLQKKQNFKIINFSSGI